jgi:hypothetical protein
MFTAFMAYLMMKERVGGGFLGFGMILDTGLLVGILDLVKKAH